MKQFIFSALIIGGLALTNAQSGLGLKAGLNLATLTGDEFENPDMKLGFNFGLTYEYEVSEKFHIQPEVLYSSQGTKNEISDTFEDTQYESEAKINLGYINIPVMFQYLPNDRLFIEAGPQIGLNINAKADFKEVSSYTIDGETITETEEDSEDIKDFVNTLDFGLGLGLGYEFVENIGASARYIIGLNSVFEDEGDDFSAQNSVLQLGVFYKF